MPERVTGATWLGAPARSLYVDPREFDATDADDEPQTQPTPLASREHQPWALFFPRRVARRKVISKVTWRQLQRTMHEPYRHRPHAPRISQRSAKITPIALANQIEEHERRMRDAAAAGEAIGEFIGKAIVFGLLFWAFASFYDGARGVSASLRLIADALRY